ncbi:hypothetical protein [Wenjunlia tyrosinilytica]|uniref:Uncharacterized protein n=1 Tax=Wenjunlia tyrosinilytica TaxID=1544741 RepID=A0A918A2A6_9ACTN|nr:hypothetical protein [Wenjunlia tyrosinilytica]GGP01290.1 hypothetical protein GCM10012280_71840 [Wenjunlia tyrosinilytica]
MEPQINLLAAVAVRELCEAVQRGELPAAVGALMSIDAASWTAIQPRLAAFGATWPDLLAAMEGPTA